MAKFKPKAEQAFETKFHEALQARSFDVLERVMNQYGSYLELVDMTVNMTPDETRARLDLVRELEGKRND